MQRQTQQDIPKKNMSYDPAEVFSGVFICFSARISHVSFCCGGWNDFEGQYLDNKYRISSSLFFG